MKTDNSLVPTLSVLYFLLLYRIRATTDGAAAAAATASPQSFNNLSDVTISTTNSDCSCCLNFEQQYSNTINIWTIMPNKDAKCILPLIYLAKEDIMKSNFLPSSWNIDIHFSNETSELAYLRAYKIYVNATRKCVQKTEEKTCSRQISDAGTVDGGARHAKKTTCNSCREEPPDVGAFLATAPYDTPRIASFATRWKLAVLSPTSQDIALADSKYQSLYRVNGDYSQLLNTVMNMATKWNWNTVCLVYENRNESKCEAAMTSIKNNLEKKQNRMAHDLKYTIDEQDQIFDEIKQKGRIVFTCFSNATSLKKFYKKANEFSDKEYAFINLDLMENMADSYWPRAGVSNVSSEDAPKLVVTTEEPPQKLSDNVRALLSDPNQTELCGHMRNIFSGSNDTSCNSRDSFTVLPHAASAYDGVWFFVDAFKRARDSLNTSSDFYGAVLEELNKQYTSRLTNETHSVDNRTLAKKFSLIKRDNNSLHYKGVCTFSINGSMECPSNFTFPRDEPVCGFDGKKCDKESLMKAIYVLACIVVALFVSSSVVFWLYKRSMKKRWQISREDLKETHHDPEQSTSEGSDPMAPSEQDGADDKNGKTFEYKKEQVSVTRLGQKISLSSSDEKELESVKLLKHNNLVRFVGVCLGANETLIVTEFCSRGSLKELLKNNLRGFEDCIKYPLFMDLIDGLSFLHKSAVKAHGNLRSTNCLVDSHLILKLSDFGPLAMSRCKALSNEEKLWTAPELLRSVGSNEKGSVTSDPVEAMRADIYSVGVIMNEIFSGHGDGPFPEDGNLHREKAEEVIKKLKETQTPPYRPWVDESAIEKKELIEIIHQCWDERPEERPTSSKIKTKMQRIFKDKKKSSLSENPETRLENYAQSLEIQVNERTKACLDAKEKWEALLHEILPPTVADELIEKRNSRASCSYGAEEDDSKPIADSFDCATIYFSDIVDFAEISARIAPMQVVDLLNSLYSRFDEIISEFNVYKVETIGDAYVVASGLPRRSGTEHVKQISKMALAILNATKTFEAPHIPGKVIQIRIGINSGSCAAGVTGHDKPRYCIYGDTVNTASRLESNGLPMKIHISESTYQLLKENYPQFHAEERGFINLKGKGFVKTYWLLEEKPTPEEIL